MQSVFCAESFPLFVCLLVQFRNCPLQEDFVKQVQNTGVVVYLSGAWLRELYQAVVSSSLLQTHGYLPTNYNSQPHALINLLTGRNFN